MSKAAASEDEEILSDEDDIESEDENIDAVMVTHVSDKDLESKSTDTDGTFYFVVVVVVEGPAIYIPLRSGKPEQQQFTIRNGIMTSIYSRQRSIIISCPLPG